MSLRVCAVDSLYIPPAAAPTLTASVPTRNSEIVFGQKESEIGVGGEGGVLVVAWHLPST